MTLTRKMREDIKETRATLKAVLKGVPDAELKSFIYNISIKAYLRGYYKGVQRSLEELDE